MKLTYVCPGKSVVSELAGDTATVYRDTFFHLVSWWSTLCFAQQQLTLSSSKRLTGRDARASMRLIYYTRNEFVVRMKSAKLKRILIFMIFVKRFIYVHLKKKLISLKIISDFVNHQFSLLIRNIEKSLSTIVIIVWHNWCMKLSHFSCLNIVTGSDIRRTRDTTSGSQWVRRKKCTIHVSYNAVRCIRWVTVDTNALSRTRSIEIAICCEVSGRIER